MKLKARLKPHAPYLIALFGIWGTYFTALFSRIIRLTPEGLYLGHVNVWSDWALHIGIANIFAYKSPHYWLAYHPMFAGGKFTYPFVTDFISGMLLRLGLTLPEAFILPSILFSFLLLLGLYAFFFLLLGSKRQSLLAISLFFLSSGPGFLKFLAAFFQNPSWATIAYPIAEYSRIDSFQWYSGNFIVGMLLPQRTFLVGLTIAVWALTLLVFALQRPGRAMNARAPLISGLLAGSLPIIHPHSFIATGVISAVLFLAYLRRWRELLWFAVPALALSLPLYFIFIHGGIKVTSFMTWHPGWTNQAGLGGWLKQWWLQWGLMLPTAVIGLAFLRRRFSPEARWVFLGCWLIFAISNLWYFQPIAWDNSKLFLWAYLGFSGLAAAVLSWLWHAVPAGKLNAVILVILLTFTGFLELIHLQQVDHNKILETTADDISLGVQIREQTDPTAVFLTSPDHNHPIMIWGARPILMGFLAWVYNFGFDYTQRQQDAWTIYQGGDAAIPLLKKNGISYVAVGPSERYNFPYLNETYFIQNFPLAFHDENYRVYDVRSVTGGK